VKVFAVELSVQQEHYPSWTTQYPTRASATRQSSRSLRLCGERISRRNHAWCHL